MVLSFPERIIRVNNALADEPAAEPQPPPRLRLDPTDWLWATWRPWTPRARRAPQPFNCERALARLSHSPVSNFTSQGVWTPRATARWLTREEAHFWFAALTEKNYDWRTGGPAAHLRGRSFTGDVALEKAREALDGAPARSAAGLLVPLANLFSLEELVDLILDPVPAHRRQSTGFRSGQMLSLISGFQKYVLPYLTEAEREQVRGLLRPLVRADRWPADPLWRPPSAFYLAACVGLHEELHAVVESWGDGPYGGGTPRERAACSMYQRPQCIVLGLGDPALVESHMRRLRLPLIYADEIHAWLAHTEVAALDWVWKSNLAIPPGHDHYASVMALGRVEAPEAAVPMLRLMLKSRASDAAREWLEAHPAHAIAGLAPVAGGRGHLAEAAADFLRALRRRGHAPALRARISAMPAETGLRAQAALFGDSRDALPPFDESSTPAWLRAVADAAPANPEPRGVLAPIDLPPIQVGDRQLNLDQVARLLTALQQSPLDAPHPLVAGLKQAADPLCLDSFARRLLQLFEIEAGVIRGCWPLISAGHLGSNSTARELAGLLPRWLHERRFDRARLGMQCLRAIGTDVALSQISRLARRASLKAAGRECLEAVAAERGLSCAELEDRIVPDCGLDEQGSRTFDLGSRQLDLVLGPNLKPLLRDQTGRLHPDLPPLSGRDDLELAAAALAGWRRLKEELAEVARDQADRLEQAMVTGRRWSVSDFERWLVRRPVMTHLARRLVWGAGDQPGQWIATFRVTEDGTYSDENERPFHLLAGMRVGVAHPCQLSPELQARWGELLCDYEIIPPFPQLGRAVRHRTVPKVVQIDLTFFNGVGSPVAALHESLLRLGWTPGTPDERGFIREYTKPFHGPRVTAVVRYAAFSEGSSPEPPKARIERCFFVRGNYRPVAHLEQYEYAPLTEVDPTAVRDVWSDLAVVVAKERLNGARGW